MPIKIGKKIFPTLASASRYLKQARPDIKDTGKYLGAIEAKITERRKAKAAKKK